MNHQPLPLLFRVLFQGTHTLLRAIRKNKKKLHHKVKHYNSNSEMVYTIAALTLQKCKCHETGWLTLCSRLKATKEITEVNVRHDAGLDPGLEKKVS